MLTQLLFRFFVTLFGASMDNDAPDAKPAVMQVQVENIETDRVAQVRLAEVLGTAEGIHSVTARGNTITFMITRDEQAFRVVATTRKGEVRALTIAPVSAKGLELGGGLTWLADELESVAAVTRLVADEDGAVTLTISDGRRYMVIPGRGSGGNAAVEARWGAEWNKG
jgi:hypothetical protein